MRYLCIIPARGGSKGLPNKNILNIEGKPLVTWSIAQALATDCLAEVIVSTDSEKIMQLAVSSGATVPFKRPDELATDLAATEPVLLHAIEWYERKAIYFDAVVLLQPTSPVRYKNSIERAIKQFEKEKADSLVSVVPNASFFWKNEENPTANYNPQNRRRRQDLNPDDWLFEENGSIYITRTKLLKDSSCRLGGKISLFKMELCESFEIDNELDWKIVELMLREATNANRL